MRFAVPAGATACEAPITGRYQAAVLLLLVVACMLCPAPAAAQPPSPSDSFVVLGVRQEGLETNDRASLTIIDASFATEHDTVRVYDGGGDMRLSSDWQVATDFENDVWVFDVGSDGQANLIITFSTDGQQHIASLYDDRNGDGRVAYSVRNGLVVEESRFWTVRVVAEGPWWDDSGDVNRNLTAWVDGPVGSPDLTPDYILDQQFNDGLIDMEYEAREVSGTDVTMYGLSRMFARPTWSIGHTKMSVNVVGSDLPKIAGYVFWPHLGPGRYHAQPPWEMGPLLTVEWHSSQLARYRGLGDVAQVIPPEAGWRVLSSDLLRKQQDNVLGFENPFAYYDLAEDNDGWPELVIRHTYGVPGSGLWYQAGNRWDLWFDPQQALQVVRYTWNQDNDRYWDYKLGLIGQNVLHDIVPFPDFGLLCIPYAELPQTLTEEMPWDGVTFVQVEAEQEDSSEGVYVWDDIFTLSRGFMFGIGDVLDAGLSDIEAPFRGEYWTQRMTTPRLYFSPLDRKLHLFGAEAGVWNVDNVRRVRYRDLDGDGYLDQWTFTQRGEVDTAEGASEPSEETITSLQLAGGFLVYGDRQRVELARAEVAPALFEASPPRDHAEWLVLGEQLSRHGAEYAADDFWSMISAFEGPRTTIRGASLQDWRLLDEGFRFVLDLQPGFEILRDDLALSLSDLDRGSYLVSHEQGFEVVPLTPSRITLPAGKIVCDPTTPRQMSWTTIRADLHNEGLRDVQSLPVRLYAMEEGGTELLLAHHKVSVPAGGSYSLAQAWFPRAAGLWSIRVEVDTAEAVPRGVQLGSLAHLEVQVQPVDPPDMFQPTAGYDGVRFTWPIALLLAGAGLAAVTVLLLLRTALPAQHDGEEGL